VFVAPKFAVSEYSLPDTSFETDIRLTKAIDATGLSILETKLGDRGDQEPVDALSAAGLAAVVCSPATVSPLPAGGALLGPEDPAERIANLCQSVRRFAPYNPDSILVITGSGRGRPKSEARQIAIEGIRAAADVAEEYGLVLSLEAIRSDLGLDISLISSLSETLQLIDEIGRPNVYVAYDIYHFWDTKDLLPLTREHADMVRGVHVADWRRITRSWCDRALPGEGIIDLPAIFEALHDGGYDGWYHLEVPSDDGRYGNDFPDSLWKLDPEELLRLGKAGFDAAWQAASQRWSGDEATEPSSSDRSPA
jgi:sugar phosphate isomerase/epimerase